MIYLVYFAAVVLVFSVYAVRYWKWIQYYWRRWRG
jgi:hypothetical protein